MNTKIVMTSSAVLMGIVGISFTFLPSEIMIYFEVEPSKFLQMMIQILGALYFAFAMLNWMSKESFIGGVYNRPIAIANLTHFLIVALALVKNVFSSEEWSLILVIVTTLYSLFAILFGIILFKHPLKDKV